MRNVRTDHAGRVRMPKRVISLLLLLLLCLPLSGCFENSALLSQREPSRQLRLSIPKGASASASEGLDVFITKVDAVSGGRVRIEKSVCDDPVAALDEGSDLVFLTNADAARANGDFTSYTSPFYFRNHTHLTITLNSASFREMTREKTASLLGASPLAAFYGGSRMFLSNESDLLDDIDGWQDLRVAVASGDELLGVVLRSLGAEVIYRDNDDLLESFLDGRSRTVDCAVTELSQLPFSEMHGYAITGFTSFHTASVDWLMLSDETAETLSDFEYAVLLEAAAYALAENDTAILNKETEAVAHAESLGVKLYPILYTAFTGAADTAFQGEVRYRNLWDWENHTAVRALAQSAE